MSIQKYYNPLHKRDVNFDALSLTIKGAEKETIGYRVYQDETHFIFIHAQTAAEALVSSGIKSPTKIMHVGIDSRDVYRAGQLNELEDKYNRFRRPPSDMQSPSVPVPPHDTVS